jgi:hypothetical protein
MSLLLPAGGATVTAGITLTFLTSEVEPTNGQIATFSSVDLGTVASDRIILVIGMWERGITTTLNNTDGITVAGSNATIVQQGVTGLTIGAELWQIADSSNSSGDIVVKTALALTSMFSMACWAMYGANSSVHDTGSSSANPMTDTVNVAAGGVAVCAGISGSNVSSFTATAGYTEEFDETVESTHRHGGGALRDGTLETNRTFTMTPVGGSPAERALVIGSYAKA